MGSAVADAGYETVSRAKAAVIGESVVQGDGHFGSYAVNASFIRIVSVKT